MKYIYFISILFITFLSGCVLLNVFSANIGENGRVGSCMQDSDECADELLIWKYDRDTKRLHFINKNVWLNCCGKHSIIIRKNKIGYQIKEKDKPKSRRSRCRCMCFYNFSIDLSIITQDAVRIELYRNVTDSRPEILLWEGVLDLEKNSGEILIRARVGWCN